MIRVVITYVPILVVSLEALFRTRREQAVVELALLSALAAMALAFEAWFVIGHGRRTDPWRVEIAGVATIESRAGLRIRRGAR